MPVRPTVSAVLIVKDEEDALERCLASVAWCDEVVVYDTGSRDATVSIARRCGAKVVEGYWDADFAAARNRALDHATQDWILSIDADEVFEGDPDRFRAHLSERPAALFTALSADVAHGTERPLQSVARPHEQAVARIFRRGACRWRGAIHEQPVPVDAASGSTSIVAMPNTILRHYGYQSEVMGAKEKGERNLAIARAALDRALATGASSAEVEVHRIQLARSFVFADRPAEALDLAREMLDHGFENRRAAVQLARAMIGSAEAAGDPRWTDRWLEVWEQNDDNPAFARAARARVCAYRGDPAGALAAVEGVPTTSLSALGERVERRDLLRVEIWALASLGQGRRAAAVAQEAAAAGVSPGAPDGLVALLGHDRTLRVLAAMTDGLWREYAMACAMEPTAQARSLLSWMEEVRPGSGPVLAAVALLAPVLSLEEAADWAVRFRAAGAAEQCPLVLVASDRHADPRQRALAGALAYSAYGDERGLAALVDALPDVAPEDEADLRAQLDVLAPGLVTSA